MNVFTKLLCPTLAILLSSASITMGASLTVAPPVGSSFTVQGTGLSDVGGIELNFSYDATLLASPTVTQGTLVSGALMAENSTVAGSIRIAIISATPISGSGPVVIINFSSRNGSAGFTSFNANVIDSKGAQLPVQYSINTSTVTTDSGFISTPGVPFSQPTTSTATSNTSSGITGASVTTTQPVSSTPYVLGTINMPSDAQPKSDTKAADTKPTDIAVTPIQTVESAVDKPVEPSAAEISATEPEKSEPVKTNSYKGVLENFRAYSGEKSPATYIALFKKEISSNIHQEPAISLTDGKTPLRIMVKLMGSGDKSPNFALNGAKLVSLNKDASSTWIIEALPLIGGIQASLTVLTDREIIEYPLTLAPPFERASANEADFVAFLHDSGATPPRRDLNGDGKHDYLDDFIYTANYLVKKGVSGNAGK